MTVLQIPTMANAHSHVFHRALRGRTQQGTGSFWTWREQMYDLASRLTPDLYLELARAVYAEMVSTGIGAVGEFHYLHHQPDGTPYDDPNEMGRALLAAADEVGIRIRLLDTCYLTSGIGQPPAGVQRRFSDGHADAWAERVAVFDDPRVGAAIHSVRAVPREQMGTVAALGGPVHVHLSEQPAENEACLAAYGVTPTRVLAEEGVLGPRTTLVHATHLTDDDVRLIGDSGALVCLCPTTERDLADGLGRGADLRAAGARISLGSDSHAVIDLFEEMRGVEMHDRLRTGVRGHWSAQALLETATGNGYASLSVGDPGVVMIDPVSPRTAGTGRDVHAAVFAATAADVTEVIIDGRVVFDGDHARVGRELEAAIEKVWSA
ncbi:formimidoylglutamate deiminase [Nocardioides stalactiti]|uniref:formimidoylglutamate deiminase n=1 Tax=Nocardioides stalactiti TaxID=2755356 RepID=UPI0016046131|nr:formimidoylglutamate deiminase [Nocardioides stalactiti]